MLGRTIAVITLAGELDICSVGTLDEAVKRTWAELPKTVHIDCRNLTFIDSMGIRAMLRAVRWLQSEGCAVAFDMSAKIVQVLNRVGLDDQMHPIERERERV